MVFLSRIDVKLRPIIVGENSSPGEIGKSWRASLGCPSKILEILWSKFDGKYPMDVYTR